MELVNPYDNSINYNINTFFKCLIGDAEKSLKNTKIIYTGDHGEMFLEDGKSTKHGGKNKLQATVPLLLIGNDLKVDTKYKATHANILPTVLDIIHYPMQLRKYPYTISLFKATEKDNSTKIYFTRFAQPYFI